MRKTLQASKAWAWIVANATDVMPEDWESGTLATLTNENDQAEFCELDVTGLERPFALIRHATDEDSDVLATTQYSTRSRIVVEIGLDVPITIAADRGATWLDFMNKVGLVRKQLIENGLRPGLFQSRNVLTSLVNRLNPRVTNGVGGLVVSYLFEGHE